MDQVLGRAFTTAMLVAMVLLMAYQLFMLRWTKKVAGSVPAVVKILRGVNIGLLAVGIILIVIQMTRG